MEPTYLEIVFDQHDLSAAGTDCDVLEGSLVAAFKEAKLGMITGGGTSSRAAMIEVELYDASRLQEGLGRVRRVLVDNRAPASTLIKQLEPELRVFGLMG